MRLLLPALLVPALALLFASCDGHDFEYTKHFHEDHASHTDSHSAEPGEGDHPEEGHKDAAHTPAPAAGEGHGASEGEEPKRPRVVPE